MISNKNEDNMKNDHENRLTRLEMMVDNMHVSYFQEIREGLKEIKKRLDLITGEIHKENIDIRKESMNQFRWVISTIIVGFMAPTLLKVFHLL